MYSKSLFFVSLLSLSSRVLCEELSEADVPPQCASICQPIVQLTAICDTDANGQTLKRYVASGDMGVNALSGKHIKLSARQNSNSPGHQCVCSNTSFDVAKIGALCASCMQQNNGKTTEINRIVSACGFPAQTFSSALESIAATINVQATRPTQSFSAAPLSAAATGVAAAPSAAANANGNGGPIALSSTADLSAIGAAINTLSVTGISSFATQTESRITILLSTMTMLATNGAAAANAAATDSPQGASAAISAQSSSDLSSAAASAAVATGVVSESAAAGISTASGAPVITESVTGTATVSGATTTGTSPAQQTKNAAAPRAVGWSMSGLVAGAVFFGML